MEPKIVVALMLAGMSSRFGGSPKALAVVAGDRTLLEVSMGQALACRPTRFILIVRKETEASFRRAVKSDAPVSFAYQDFDPARRSKPFGTTDAVCAALSLVDETERLVVMNGDDLYGESSFRLLRDAWPDNADGVVGVCPMSSVVPARGRVNRGTVAIDGDRVVGVEEWIGVDRSTPGIETALASVNLIGIGPRLARAIQKDLEAARADYYDDPTKECMLTESMDRALRGDPSLRIGWFPLKERVIGITHPGDEDQIRRSLGAR